MNYIGGWAGGAGGGWGGRWWGGWEAEGGQYHPQGDKQQCCVLSRAQKLPQSTWQAQTVVSSSLTPQTALLVPITGPIDPVVGPSWFYRVGKRPPVKADLAIYSLVVGMSGLWVNVATMLNNKLDFYYCDNSVGFCKSGHK